MVNLPMYGTNKKKIFANEWLFFYGYFCLIVSEAVILIG